MSFAKNLQSLDKVIGICTGLGSSYKPGQQALQVDVLTTLYFNAQQLMDEIAAAEATRNKAVIQRFQAFRNMRDLATRIGALMKSSGADPMAVEDVRAITRMIQGRIHKSRSAVPGEAVEGSDAERTLATHSTAFATQLYQFGRLVETVSASDEYAVIDSRMSKEALAILLEDLRNLNRSVEDAESKLRDLRSERRKFFHDGEDSLVSTTRKVRDYMRGIFGFNSEPHRNVGRLSLTKRKS